MPATGYVTSAAYLEHDPGPGHPERAERLRAIERELAQSGLADELARAEPQPASRAELERVHSPRLAARVAERCDAGHDFVDSPDAAISRASYEVARLAAGGALHALRKVVAGEWANAFVAARPPGHHAEEDLAMGFCLFNNAAVAARGAQVELGLARVAIVDFDVHHGNGTQHLFERDPSVLYVSLHEHPHYPGTGAAGERGLGAGEGFTLNCPLPARSGDREWLGAFEERALPALDAFAPELVIVSAGFDAHARDPLSSTRLSEDAYAQMTRGLVELAARHAAGRILSLLEGGYDLEGLARSAHAHLAELARAAR